MVWRFDNRHDTKVWYWLKDKSKQTKESTQTYAYVHAHLCTGHEHTQVLGLLRSSLSSAKGCECPLIFHELVKYLQDQKLNYKGFKKKKWLSSVFCTQKYRLRIWSYFFFIYGPKKIRQFFFCKEIVVFSFKKHNIFKMNLCCLLLMVNDHSLNIWEKFYIVLMT